MRQFINLLNEINIIGDIGEDENEYRKDHLWSDQIDSGKSAIGHLNEYDVLEKNGVYFVRSPYGDLIGRARVDDIGNNLHRVGHIWFAPEIRGRGLGYLFYTYLLDQRGLRIVSDHDQTKSAMAVWAKLAKNGYVREYSREKGIGLIVYDVRPYYLGHGALLIAIPKKTAVIESSDPVSTEGWWIDEFGRIHECNHQNDWHHADIAMDELEMHGDEDDGDEDDGDDEFVRDGAIEEAFTQGWVRASTYNGSISVEWRTVLSPETKAALLSWSHKYFPAFHTITISTPKISYRAFENKSQKAYQYVRSGLVEPALSESSENSFDLSKAAIEHFGITRNPLECGYLLADGQMLDMSGRHYDGSYIRQGTVNVRKHGETDYAAGHRLVDHRELDDDWGLSDGTDGMWEFMEKTGAVRVNPKSGFDFIKAPTRRQMAMICVMAEFYGGGVYLDVLGQADSRHFTKLTPNDLVKFLKERGLVNPL